MQTKVKTVREFTFKAYTLAAGQEALNNVHTGEFMFKSDCHYYTEKAVLDFVKGNMAAVERDGYSYAIYKVSTVEDSKCEDLLIELITVKDGKINIA